MDSLFLHFAALVNPEGGGGDGHELSIKARVGAGDRRKLSLHFLLSFLFFTSVSLVNPNRQGNECRSCKDFALLLTSWHIFF